MNKNTIENEILLLKTKLTYAERDGDKAVISTYLSKE